MKSLYPKACEMHKSANNSYKVPSICTLQQDSLRKNASEESSTRKEQKVTSYNFSARARDHIQKQEACEALIQSRPGIGCCFKILLCVPIVILIN